MIIIDDKIIKLGATVEIENESHIQLSQTKEK